MIYFKRYILIICFILFSTNLGLAAPGYDIFAKVLKVYEYQSFWDNTWVSPISVSLVNGRMVNVFHAVKGFSWDSLKPGDVIVILYMGNPNQFTIKYITNISWSKVIRDEYGE